MNENECIGFAECPCPKCSRTRVSVTQSHPEHDERMRSYCGACRTAEIQLNRVFKG